MKELRHYSATQLLTAGTDLNTVAGRLGHAEGSTTLRFHAQFTRPADRNAAVVIPAQLDGLRNRERLRELYRQAPSGHDLGHLASTLGPRAGLDLETALGFLTEFAAGRLIRELPPLTVEAPGVARATRCQVALTCIS